MMASRHSSKTRRSSLRDSISKRQKNEITEVEETLRSYRSVAGRTFGYGSLEIFAPYLQHLDISKELFSVKCRLVNVSSLVTASLTFHITCITDGWEEDDIEEHSCCDYHQDIRNLVLDYLENLSHATELIIGTWFAELEQSYFAEVDNINLPSWIPNTVFPNLKSVKIQIFPARSWRKRVTENIFKVWELGIHPDVDVKLVKRINKVNAERSLEPTTLVSYDLDTTRSIDDLISGIAYQSLNPN
ncbi:hypothetical protein HAX54_033864 [Datura stramonium]|uniref:Uncharacterized protein n=1 Tax=Datura stramonium TaxID=4076 RepID=A0ABS8VEE2_DATST|nr:hypothetical protein [Datura stramonium]